MTKITETDEKVSTPDNLKSGRARTTHAAKDHKGLTRNSRRSATEFDLDHEFAFRIVKQERIVSLWGSARAG